MATDNDNSLMNLVKQIKGAYEVQLKATMPSWQYTQTTTTGNTIGYATPTWTTTTPVTNIGTNLFNLISTQHTLPKKPKSNARRNSIAQGWANVDNWYLGPKEDKKDEINKIAFQPFYRSFGNKSSELSARLAHKCPDGKLRAPTGVKIHHLAKGRGISIYGKCSHCGDKISEKIKTLIRLEELNV